MPKTTAFSDLSTLAQGLALELESLGKKTKEPIAFDLSLTGHILRALQSMREIVHITELEDLGSLLYTLETIINKLNHGLLAWSPPLSKAMITAIRLVDTCAQQMKTSPPLLKKTQKKLEQYFSHETQQTQPLVMPDLKKIGLGDQEVEELSEQEKNLLLDLWHTCRTITSYRVHLPTEHLEHHVTTIINSIQQHGTFITVVPIQSSMPTYDYAFAFLFSSKQSLENISAVFQFPGSLTTLSDGPNEHKTIQHIGQSTTNSNQILQQNSEQQTTSRYIHIIIGEHHYALLFSCIVDIILFEKNKLMAKKNHYTYQWRNKTIDTYFLKDIINKPSNTSSAQPTEQNILVVFHKNRTIALIVDRIAGQEEIFTHPPTTGETPLYAGHFEYGNGKLGAIIHIEKLFEVIPYESESK